MSKESYCQYREVSFLPNGQKYSQCFLKCCLTFGEDKTCPNPGTGDRNCGLGKLLAEQLKIQFQPEIRKNK